MPSEINVKQLIAKLTRETATGNLTWERQILPGSLREGTDDRYPVFLVAVYKEQPIALAERRFQDFNEEFERLYWNSSTVLMLLDSGQDEVIWEYSERSPALFNLFNLATESAGNVDNVIRRLITDD